MGMSVASLASALRVGRTKALWFASTGFPYDDAKWWDIHDHYQGKRNIALS